MTMQTPDQYDSNEFSNFWTKLPGSWQLQRFCDGELFQTGIVEIIKKTKDFYQFREEGVYCAHPNQHFFRDYQYHFEKESICIYGKNPRDGFVLLHTIAPSVQTHTHWCKNDSYDFTLLEFTQNAWSTSVVISGPKKNTKLLSFYNRCKQTRFSNN